jgi:hypothetical protein
MAILGPRDSFSRQVGAIAPEEFAEKRCENTEKAATTTRRLGT